VELADNVAIRNTMYIEANYYIPPGHTATLQGSVFTIKNGTIILAASTMMDIQGLFVIDSAILIVNVSALNDTGDSIDLIRYQSVTGEFANVALQDPTGKRCESPAVNYGTSTFSTGLF